MTCPHRQVEQHLCRPTFRPYPRSTAAQSNHGRSGSHHPRQTRDAPTSVGGRVPGVPPETGRGELSCGAHRCHRLAWRRHRLRRHGFPFLEQCEPRAGRTTGSGDERASHGRHFGTSGIRSVWQASRCCWAWACSLPLGVRLLSASPAEVLKFDDAQSVVRFAVVAISAAMPPTLAEPS